MKVPSASYPQSDSPVNRASRARFGIWFKISSLLTNPLQVNVNPSHPVHFRKVYQNEK